MVQARFHMQANDAGIAAVSFYPHRMLWNNLAQSGTNFFPYAKATTSAYVGQPTDGWVLLNDEYYTSAQQTWYQNLTTNTSPYPQNFFSTPAIRSARLVGAGLRVLHTGKMVDVQGEYTIWQNPTASSKVASDEDDNTSLLAVKTTGWTRVTADTVPQVNYVPLEEGDLQYVRAPGYQYGVAQALDDPFHRLAGAILVQGAAPLTPYIVEAVAHFEVRGASIAVEQNPSDPKGQGIVMAAASAMPTQRLQASRLQDGNWDMIAAGAKAIIDGFVAVGEHPVSKAVVEATRILNHVNHARRYAKRGDL